MNTKQEVLASEQGIASTHEQLLEYVERIGMLHLNRNNCSRSVGNVWDWSKGEAWAVLMDLMESRQIFLCKALGAKRTYTSPEVAVALIRLAGDRLAGLSWELQQVYELIRTEGPLSRRNLSELCGHTAKDCRAILDQLVGGLLIAPFERERRLRANWDELTYWTVDEWLLDHDIDASTLEAGEIDEETIISAAAKCLMSGKAKELAKALAWPAAKVEACIERLSRDHLREVSEPVQLGKKRDNRSSR